MAETETAAAAPVDAKSSYSPEELARAIALLRDGAAKCRSLEEHFEFVMSYNGPGPFYSIKCYQLRAEVCGLMRTLQKENVRTCAELGTAAGGTLYMLTRAVADDALIISVDLPNVTWAFGNTSIKVPLFEAMARAQQRVICIRADSKRIATRVAFERALAGRLLDFLLIDGDHSHYGVKTDFEHYRHYVRPGGLIGFHDIKGGHPYRPMTGVMEFWREVKNDYQDRIEFVTHTNQSYCGIGLIRV
jgi:predicted O-methyltransferase YrrM